MRVDANREIGYGHLKRCLVIADCLRQRGESVYFILGGDAVAAREVRDSGFECYELDISTRFSAQATELDNYSLETDRFAILDLAHCRAIEDSQGFALYSKAFKQKCFTVLIDAFGVQSLRENVPELCCNILASPYCGEQESRHPIRYVELLGVYYYVIDTPYITRGDREIRQHASRVLVTCGGSDPMAISARILNALNLTEKRKLSVKLVVGPGFPEDLVDRLAELSDSSPHKVELVYSPGNLSAEMNWCDMAIATSGLTKYELAATGTPAILLSIDKSHDTVNRQFIAAGSATDLGVVADLTDETLVNSLWALLDDETERRRQSLAGRSLVTGEGAQNLVQAIFQQRCN